jgi:hypothetical protein
MKRNITNQAIPLIILTAYLLTACSGAATAGPATLTARARRVVAQATDVALQLRQASILDAKQATATAQNRLDRLAQVSGWPVILSDTFDNNANEWVLGQQTGQYADASFAIANGIFRWEITSHQGFVWWNHPTISRVTDFHLAVDCTQTSGPAGAYMGLMMRLNDNGDYYLFSLQNTGDYSFDVYFNGQWLSLIDWTPSPAIQVDEANHMEVIAEGTRFSLFVNGYWLADYEDQTIPSGYCGLLVGMDDVDVSAAWEFNNFELRAAPTVEETAPPEQAPTP